MALSLRFLISALLGALILGVSMLAFFLVFNVSVDEIKKLTRTHAVKVAAGSAVKIHEQFNKVSTVMKAVQNATDLALGSC